MTGRPRTLRADQVVLVIDWLLQRRRIDRGLAANVKLMSVGNVGDAIALLQPLIASLGDDEWTKCKASARVKISRGKRQVKKLDILPATLDELRRWQADTESKSADEAILKAIRQARRVNG